MDCNDFLELYHCTQTNNSGCCYLGSIISFFICFLLPRTLSPLYLEAERVVSSPQNSYDDQDSYTKISLVRQYIVFKLQFLLSFSSLQGAEGLGIDSAPLQHQGNKHLDNISICFKSTFFSLTFFLSNGRIKKEKILHLFWIFVCWFLMWLLIYNISYILIYLKYTFSFPEAANLHTKKLQPFYLDG